MKTIGEHLSAKPQKGALFGVEIEVENVCLNGVPSVPEVSGWAAKGDSSLRAGIEFVTRTPESLTRTVEKLRQYEKVLSKYTYSFSFRTSVHVHMNMQDLTLQDVAKITLAYSSIEKLLGEFCGRSRMNNRFCLDIHHNSYYTEDLYSSLTPDFVRKSLAGTANVSYVLGKIATLPRYSSVNLRSLTSFGTLEFRSLRGTEDVGTIIVWIRILNALRSNALTFDVETLTDYKVSFRTAKAYLSALLGESELVSYLLFDDYKDKIVSCQKATKRSLVSGLNTLTAKAKGLKTYQQREGVQPFNLKGLLGSFTKDTPIDLDTSRIVGSREDTIF
jgi:hypothetical protein